MLLDVEGSATCRLKVSFKSSWPAIRRIPFLLLLSSPLPIELDILTATTAQGVRLVVAFTETGGTLRYEDCQSCSQDSGVARGVLMMN